MVTARKNAELATTMLALAKEADTQRKEDINDPKVRQQLDELEASMRTSRQRWRIMKGTASATIAESGVDWARDPKLLEIALDNDGDER
jgi:Centromere protein H (CENP-H)